MIKYYNRKTKKYDIEQVAGDKYLTWTYSSPLGMFFLEKFIKRKIFSKLYGYYCDSRFSIKKISQFITTFNIDISEFKDDLNSFKCFNDFFYRKLKESSRPIDSNTSTLISPGDGRLKVFTDIDLNALVQIKGFSYSLYELIDDTAIANKFKNGTCMILRLCPTDYHRFHFLDNGVCEPSKQIKGNYYSVNPVALKKIPNLFSQNKREWSLFHSENFGEVLYVEVGATCVGSILQSYSPGSHVAKGTEKGYFKFGGSTIVLFFQQKKVKIAEDILNQSRLDLEVKVSMGEPIGIKL